MTDPPSIAYLSIGSNKGDKAGNLKQAIDCLNQHDLIQVAAVSFFYRTEPQNFEDQDWFVNAAVKIQTPVEPAELLDILKQIERSLDPEGKAFRFGPRKIDLDIILFENRVLKTDLLEIPHPRMQERCFVLRPMCDIGADTLHPVFHKTPRQLLMEIEKQESQKVILLD
ncbi:MAG: 2-amino-4-hydroxy-6-hydroxymethyldihydropteridine diphosphokinase [Proteobacteria bacterium]|nr:2-amino-4-hydroxy-6-hydroxymethyldihydropteridine diphosphokinase [Desulfobacula sp.]MBU3954366.1 2-amino-4-hydroxy-6-hydroxymethyldihydropteridine diphosphokinase [Pseudomonadota bacterium]MBU4133573.1 2-amino-4-hydroxy-6-hydroxymethyldihydropteridine diphosphokinase [Pseudomonadota bacterium]